MNEEDKEEDKIKDKTKALLILRQQGLKRMAKKSRIER